MILHPSFPEEGVQEERFLQLGEIKRSFDSSMARPFQLALEARFGSHPYGLPTNGYSTSLEEQDAESVRAWWKEHVVSDGALAVVVGDISASDAKSIIEASFADLPRRQGEMSTAAVAAAPLSRLEVIEYRDRKQSAIVYAFPTVPGTHEDWPKLRLMGNITSGLAGTFFAELRGRRSLAYTVFAGEASNQAAGTFYAYLASDASKETEAKEALLAEMRRLAEDGFGETELARAKSYFAGSTKIALQTNSAQAGDLSRNWFFGLPLDFTTTLTEDVQDFTLAEMREIAARYFLGDSFAGAVVKGKS